MHYRRLGRSGLKISEISLGAWITFGSQLGEEAAAELIHAAYDQGVNFFDNADMNANGLGEELMGRAIGELPREALVISSKVFWPTMPGPNGRGLSRKHVTDSIAASLRRLRVNYLDLYFCHRYDPDTPVEEVVWIMNDLIHQGKILYWGTSEWEAWQVSEAIGVARQLNLIGPTMEQPQYNLFHRRRVELELGPIAREFGLGLTTYSPLYNGILSGKYNEGIPEGSRAAIPDYAWVRALVTPERVAITRQLTQLAQALGLTTAQLAIAWALRRKEVSCVITGATSLEQLDENIAASEYMDRMTDEILEQIEKIASNLPE
jgi:voltage-dependent potassium channel beta subunit